MAWGVIKDILLIEPACYSLFGKVIEPDQYVCRGYIYNEDNLMRRLMRHTTLLLAICFIFVGYPFRLYADSKQPVSSVYVYKLDGTKQCETDPGITLVTMERDLISAGVKVISRRKGFDGREGITLCGAPTGQINIYEISRSDLPVAIGQDFMKLPMTGTKNE